MMLEELLQSIEPLETNGSLSTEITSICYDSRKAEPGALFVAVPGHKVDGVEYVTEALSRGASAVVSENKLDLGHQTTSIQVADARLALAQLSAHFYGEVSKTMQVMGITGTNGKTTTSYMIRAILRAAGRKPGLLGTVAYEIGTRTLPASRTTPEAPEIHHFFQQMKESGCDSVVMEVSSHALALKRIHGIDFDLCVFTNLTQDHLDYHKDMESYFCVKAALFQKPGHRAVVNIDDPWGRRLVEFCTENNPLTTCGFSSEADLQASHEKVDINGTSFHLASPWGEAEIHLNLLGRFNIYNALSALAVGGLLGIPLPLMAEALKNLPHVPGRLQLVPNRKNKKVFVDYAHTDDALRNVLSTLREICPEKLFVVFGCGGNRDRGKRPLMGQVADQLADYSILTADNPRNEDPTAIALEIAEGFSGFDHFEIEIDRRTAIEKALRKMGKKDILLVAGKGHETYQESQGTIIPFDDRETILEILG